MMRIKIAQCLEDGAKLYTANFKKLVLASLVAVYLMFVSGFIFAGAVMIGMLMLIAAFDNDEDVKNGIPYVFRGFKYFLSALLIYLSIIVVMAAIMYLGYLLHFEFLYIVALVIAFAIGICVMYSFFFIYEENANFIDASKKSFELVKKDVFGSFLLLVLIKIISGAGVLSHSLVNHNARMLLPIIAVMVFMMPLAMCIYYKGYKSLAQNVLNEAPEPEPEKPQDDSAEKEAEYFAKEDVQKLDEAEKEAEKKAVEVIEPEVLDPEEDVFGV
jgi:hypothetical protein